MKQLIYLIAVGDCGVDGFLKSFDVDKPAGAVVATRNPAEAMQFENVAAAIECWRSQSTVQPLRRDGKPNRPLTAFTIEFVNADPVEARAHLTAQLFARAEWNSEWNSARNRTENK